MKKKYVLTKTENGETLYYSAIWNDQGTDYSCVWSTSFDQRTIVTFGARYTAEREIEVQGLETSGYFEIKKVYF